MDVIDVVVHGEDFEHLDMVVIDVDVHGEDWVDDHVVKEAFADLLDGVRRGIEENMGFEEEVRLKSCPILSTNPSVYKSMFLYPQLREAHK